MTEHSHDQAVDVVRRLYAAVDEDGLAAISSFIDPDAVQLEPRRHWWSRRVSMRGNDVIAVGLLALRDELRLNEVLGADGRVFAALCGRDSDAEDVFFQVFEVRDGLVVSVEAFPSRDEALRSAGL